MGRPTGFLEVERVERGYEKPAARKKSWQRVRPSAARAGAARAGLALHGLRHPVLPRGLPGQQPDPGLEQPGLSRPVAAGAGCAALDQQLPGIHRPHLPGAVRGVLHAEHRRQPGHDQNDRMRDRRPRLAGRLDRAAGAGPAHRQAGGGGRVGTGRHGLRPAIGARRPCRDLVREGRPDRRAAALRHPRLQDGERADRPPGRADGGGRGRVPHLGRSRASMSRSTSC